ncbi:VC0807 family protein [Streptomyces sp. NPDC004232]|uniref:VC0807 family protein n=1 Tax=Streptomyces sp. NPDC004232 TaxID=3154454 RepID=UPI0033A54E8A
MKPTTQQRPQLGGMMTVLLDLFLSIGGYYALRALGVGVIWALTVPGILIGVLTVMSTIRRRKLDVVGVLVLVELTATLGLTFATDDARIAACRQPLYVVIGGAFCLATLVGHRPFTAVTTASMATFGDPLRVRAFETAWQEHPEYRQRQRTLTVAIGTIMIVDAAVRILLIYLFPASRIDRSLLLSNITGILMFVIIGVVSKKLIMPARELVLGIVEQLRAEQPADADARAVAASAPKKPAKP